VKRGLFEEKNAKKMLTLSGLANTIQHRILKNHAHLFTS